MEESREHNNQNVPFSIDSIFPHVVVFFYPLKIKRQNVLFLTDLHLDYETFSRT